MKKLSTMILATLLTFGMAYAQEEKFELDGAIQISNSEDPTPDAGTIRYNTSTNTFEGHNGTSWVSLVTDADADPSNEIQILSISGDTLNLSGGGMAILPEVGRLHIWDSLRNTINLQSIDNKNTGIAFQNTNSTYQWNIYKKTGANGHLIFAGGNADSEIDSLIPRMVIRPDGHVGIGTSNPVDVLHVVGDSRIEGKLETFGSNAVFNQGGDPVNFRVESEGSQDMLNIDGTSNRVGINKNNPSATLDVNGTSMFRDDFTFNPQNDTSDFRIASQSNDNLFFANGTNNRIGIGTNMPTTGLDIRAQTAIKNNVFINPDQELYNFRISTGDSLSAFFVNGANNRIGIGTNAPTTGLDIRTITAFYNNVVINPDQGNNFFRISSIDSFSLFQVNGATNRIGIGTNAPTNGLDIRTVTALKNNVLINPDQGNNFLRIASVDSFSLFQVNGATNRIGIGTNSPTTGLDIRTVTAMKNNVLINPDQGNNFFRISSIDSFSLFQVNGATNRIGIGTNSPTAQMDIRLLTVFKNSTYFNPTQLDKIFRISTMNTLNAFYVDAANDRIGIGTAAPAATLDVDGSFISRGGAFTINEDGENFDFRVESDNNEDMLLVDGTNNRVGIGVPVPQVDFHVKGESRFVNGDAVFNEGSGSFDFRVESNNESHMFYLDGTNNRIGIGTDSPTQMLDVDGNTYIKGQLEVVAGGSTQPLLIKGNGGSAPVGITQNGTGGVYSMELTTSDGSANQATRMLLGGNSANADVRFYRGDKGSEIETLTIEGTTGEVTMSRDSVQGDWGLYIENKKATGFLGGIRMNDDGFLELTVNADDSNPARARLNNTGDWEIASDRRLKSNIVPAENMLQKALELSPVNYQFISDASQKMKIGFIAQDVQKVLPEMVSEGDIYTLNYAGLSVVAIGAIKELHQANALLEDRVEVLESKLQTIDEIKAELKKEVLEELQNELK